MLITSSLLMDISPQVVKKGRTVTGTAVEMTTREDAEKAVRRKGLRSKKPLRPRKASPRCMAAKTIPRQNGSLQLSCRERTCDIDPNSDMLDGWIVSTMMMAVALVCIQGKDLFHSPSPTCMQTEVPELGKAEDESGPNSLPHIATAASADMHLNPSCVSRARPITLPSAHDLSASTTFRGVNRASNQCINKTNYSHTVFVTT
eukprot:768489-Hanusia_phi.AAC.3